MAPFLLGGVLAKQYFPTSKVEPSQILCKNLQSTTATNARARATKKVTSLIGEDILLLQGRNGNQHDKRRDEPQTMKLTLAQKDESGKSDSFDRA